MYCVQVAYESPITALPRQSHKAHSSIEPYVYLYGAQRLECRAALGKGYSSFDDYKISCCPAYSLDCTSHLLQINQTFVSYLREWCLYILVHRQIHGLLERTSTLPRKQHN